MIQDIPAAWDETKHIAGMPASHIVIARRKGQVWYIGGMTDKARTVPISFDFLDEGKNYNALICSDETHTTMKREIKSVKYNTNLSIALLERGGFSIRINPVD